MNPNVFLETPSAVRLYEQAKALPIVDYHCHLSPQEIYEDRPYDNLAQLWLDHDHYKWRLMRQFGIEETFITGDAPARDKFLTYAECIGLAAGSPLYHWTMMELSLYFGIEEPLNAKSAPEIWERANRVIREGGMSPRKLMVSSKVEWVATTDDPAEPLTFHRLLKEDKTFPITVTPTFRTDRLANLTAADYPAYIARLSETAGEPIKDWDSLTRAVVRRLDEFCALGCRFSDVGIEAFPSAEGSVDEAKEIFVRALNEEPVSNRDYRVFLTFLYRFLAQEYRKRGITMQLHLAVTRNANHAMFEALGPDCGGDCVGETVPVSNLIGLFNGMLCDGGNPRIILYTLNPAMYSTMATAAGSFPNILLGAAWWFNDHKAGIEEQLRLCAQNAHLAAFPGMLTDSRSFLSYARHDYFRRIFCNFLGNLLERGEYLDEAGAVQLIRRVCYENSLSMTK